MTLSPRQKIDPGRRMSPPANCFCTSDFGDRMSGEMNYLAYLQPLAAVAANRRIVHLPRQLLK
jgi:hypothetical protein